MPVTKLLSLGREPRILIWDGEMTNLKASIGDTICIGYRWFGDKKPTILSVRDFSKNFARDPSCDKQLIKAFSEVYKQADMDVTWYGKRFDWRFVQSRCMFHNLHPLPRIKQWDGWEVARHQLALHSNRLQAVEDFLDLAVHKTAVRFRIWRKAMTGHIPSIKYIEDHCYGDVDVLYGAYVRMAPFSPHGYNLNTRLVTGDNTRCPNPACKGGVLRKNGVRVAVTRVYQRWSCTKCGSWYKSFKAITTGLDIG